MAGLIAEAMRINGFRGSALAEPFAGGAGASLKLLYSEEVGEIHLNDLDPAIHAFWWTLLNRPGPFLRRLDSVRVSMAEWRRQRAVYSQSRSASKLSLAFATFFLNRCNRSGIIINAGPIGGMRQQGEWKIGARFNKSELRQRCERVAEYSERITISCEDGIDFVVRMSQSGAFLFIDPPYYDKGGTLYLNRLDHRYHERLALTLRRLNTPWVLTYDDCPQIRDMYSSWASVRSFALQYSASRRRRGSEILISPKGLRLPTLQFSRAIDW